MRGRRATDLQADAMLGCVALAALAAPTAVVVAADYLSIEAAQKAVFPEGTRFDEVVLRPTPAQLQAILALAGPQPRRGSLRVWEVHKDGQVLGHFFVDEVIGREELITYALGIDANAKVRTPEVMAYRESHGGEIRNTGWLKQFARADDLEHMRFRVDIKNIAGATLSSEHVTQGVRYLLALWQTTLAHPPAST